MSNIIAQLNELLSFLGNDENCDLSECEDCLISKNIKDAISELENLYHLKHCATRVVKAVWDMGSHPEHHMRVMKRHEKEWPFLWNSIHQLVESTYSDDQ